MERNRTLALQLFPEGITDSAKRALVAFPLVVSLSLVLLLQERILLYLLLGVVGATVFWILLYRFADRSVTKAVFLILLATIALQQSYLGFPVDSTRVARFLLLLWALKSMLSGELKWEKGDLNWAIILLLGVSFCSSLVAGNLGICFGFLKRYLYLAILYFVVIQILRQRDFTVKALKVYAFLAFLSAVFGVWQFSGFFGKAVSRAVSEVTFGLPRARGLHIDANLSGAYLGSALPLAVGLFLGSRGRKEKAFWLVASVVTLGALLFTVSRSAMIGLTCAVLTLCLYSSVIRRGYLKAAALSLYLVLPLGVVFAREFYLFWVGVRNLFLKSITVYAHLSTELHLWMYKTALKMFVHNPVLGVGLANFQNDMRDYMEPHPALNRLYWWAVTHHARVGVHSTWLEILSDTGLLGFLAFALVLGLAFRYFHLANRRFSGRDPQLFYVSTALMGGLVALCFGGLFYSYQFTPMLWFFLASSCVMHSLARRGERV